MVRTFVLGLLLMDMPTVRCHSENRMVARDQATRQRLSGARGPRGVTDCALSIGVPSIQAAEARVRNDSSRRPDR